MRTHTLTIGIGLIELHWCAKLNSEILNLNQDTRDEDDKWMDRGLTAYELYKTIKGVLSRPKDLRVVLILEAIKHENDIQWWVEEVFLGVNHFPVEADNNDIIGG